MHMQQRRPAAAPFGNGKFYGRRSNVKAGDEIAPSAVSP
jgi:hypothetical protein